MTKEEVLQGIVPEIAYDLEKVLVLLEARQGIDYTYGLPIRRKGARNPLIPSYPTFMWVRLGSKVVGPSTKINELTHKREVICLQ